MSKVCVTYCWWPMPKKAWATDSPRMIPAASPLGEQRSRDGHEGVGQQDRQPAEKLDDPAKRTKGIKNPVHGLVSASVSSFATTKIESRRAISRRPFTRGCKSVRKIRPP